MEHNMILLTLAIIFGFFMAWGLGANDVANAMGTSVGSKALTFRQATVIAAIFEALGSILAGGQVTETIRGGIIDPQLLASHPQLLIYGMLASLLSAGLWLLLASMKGWPVSTTHCIVGAIIGFGVINLGPNVIHWHEVITIVLSWIITPLISGVLAYLIFTSIKVLILNSKDPFQRAKRYLPCYIMFVAFVISMVTLNKGLKHMHFQTTFIETLLLSLLISFFIAFIGFLALRRVKINPNENKEFHYTSVERLFGILMIFTACCMAFAHGSNDVANAIGPLAAIVSIIHFHNHIGHQAYLPFWVLLLGAAGIVTGLAMYGYKVIETIGHNITSLTPSRGLSAELATATTVVLASGTGLPISTTQTLVGAVLGVGVARGIGAINLQVVRGIFMSWVITLPVGAFLAIIFFYIIRFIFGG